MNCLEHSICISLKLFLKLTNVHFFSRSRSTRESPLLHHRSVHSDSCHLSQVKRNGTFLFFWRNWPLYFYIIIILVNLKFWKQQPHFCCIATFVQSMTGQNLTFKVNFQCQEPCQSFWKRFFPFKNSSLGEHGVLLTFLYYSNF